MVTCINIPVSKLFTRNYLTWHEVMSRSADLTNRLLVHSLNRMNQNSIYFKVFWVKDVYRKEAWFHDFKSQAVSIDQWEFSNLEEHSRVYTKEPIFFNDLNIIILYLLMIFSCLQIVIKNYQWYLQSLFKSPRLPFFIWSINNVSDMYFGLI